MKYNQPFDQPSNPDAPYVNGNPSTGTMGSIPPAASIEHPQREIVNFINKCGLTPTAADLNQLAKAVQSGMVNWGADNGVVNQIAITPVVPVTQYQVGLRFVIKVKYGNTSQVTVNVSGIGNVPLIHVDQTPLVAYELLAGQLIEVAYDGANFQAIAGVSGGAVVMTAPQNLYVNDSIGSDTLYDGTSATIAGVMGGPFKTVQKALATMTKYNLGGWDFNINVADGVYTNTNYVEFPRPNGSGRVVMKGNITDPTSCSIFNTLKGTAWFLHQGGNYWVQGFSFRCTATNYPAGDAGCGLWIQEGTNVYFGDCDFAGGAAGHVAVGAGTFGFVFGTIFISGGAGVHFSVGAGGALYNSIPAMPNLTINNAVTFSSAFLECVTGGQARPVYTTITGAGNVTGKKYNCYGNGVADTGGRGINYLPGDVAGTTATGGQYL